MPPKPPATLGPSATLSNRFERLGPAQAGPFSVPVTGAGGGRMSIVRLSDVVARSLMVLAAVWAFVLCFIFLADVVGRTFFNAPLHGTIEIVANSIVMIVFLQAGFAIRSQSMLRTEVLVNALGPNAQRVAFGFAD